MSQIPYTFNQEGMRRAVAAIRAVEANDMLYSGVKPAKRGVGFGPEAFIIGRVTAVDSSDPTLVSVQEQFWDDATSSMIDLPNGRLWDGESGNPPKVRLIDGGSKLVDDLVILGFKYGAEGAATWFALPSGDAKFHATLGSATAISSTFNRWAYPFAAAKYETAGTWSAISGGLTGTAYNTIEANNTETGVQGCGINVDNLPTGWAIKPIGPGAVVEITPVVNCETFAVEYVFQAVNNADGECP